MSDKESTLDIHTGPIFCFGSNTAGAHGAGSALAARRQYGAQLGVGNGLSGQSYGVPTCNYNTTSPVITPLEQKQVREYVEEFIAYANANPELIFMMTKIGTGIGSFSEADICNILHHAPDNVDMPLDWLKPMRRKSVLFGTWEELYPQNAISMEKHRIQPLDGGFSLTTTLGFTKSFRWNTDRSRIQNAYEALRFDMGFAEAGLVETLSPEEDGVTHINIYSKAKTSIGKFLSNFAESDAPIQTPDGEFKSVEGYWYWLSTPEGEPNREELCHAVGIQAKKLGQELRGDDFVKDAAFMKKICSAIETKLGQSPKAQAALADTGMLPLVHYYNYGGKLVEPKEDRWVVDWIYVLRQRLQKAQLSVGCRAMNLLGETE